MAYSAQARTNMITNQLEPSGVVSQGLLEAIAKVPRELFVPKEFQEASYLDDDIPLGHGNRYLIEPRVFARLLQAAEVIQRHRVLDIACGTGYSSAILAELTEHIVAIESAGELAEVARRNLHELKASVELFNASLIGGYSLKAPYDLIFINGAVSFIPDELIEQLSEGGRIVGVLCENPHAGIGQAIRWTKMGERLHPEILFDATIPLLTEFEQKRNFEF